MHKLFERCDAFLTLFGNSYLDAVQRLTFRVEDLHGEAEAISRAYVADDDVVVLGWQCLDIICTFSCFLILAFNFWIIIAPDLSHTVSVFVI